MTSVLGLLLLLAVAKPNSTGDTLFLLLSRFRNGRSPLMDLRRRSIISIKVLTAVCVTIMSFYPRSFVFSVLSISCLLLGWLARAHNIWLLLRLTNRVWRWPLWRLSVTSDSIYSRLIARAQNLFGNVDSALLASSLKGVTHFWSSVRLLLLWYRGESSVCVFMNGFV
jgi:hypothetical protein